MTNQKIRYSRKTNLENWKGFGRGKKEFRCVICDNLVDIGGSCSNQGYKLTCNWCVRNEFENIIEAFDWMNYLEEEDLPDSYLWE